MKNGAIIGSSIILMLGAGFAWGSWVSTKDQSVTEDASPSQSTETPHTELGPVSQDYFARVDSLERVLVDRPEDNAARLALARHLHDAHRAAEAVDLYREYLRRSPDDRQAHFDLAKAYGTLGNWSEAAVTMEEFLAKQPEDFSAMYNLGTIEANRDRPAEAARWLERVRAEADDTLLVSQAETALQRLAGE